jgi:signal transduction histidine kinase
MRPPALLGTVCIVSSDHLSAKALGKSVQLAVGKRQWLLTLVLAGCAAAAAIALAPGPGPRGPASALLFACLICGLIVLLRRWPLPVFAVSLVATGSIMAFGTAPLPLAAVLGVATYFVASGLRRRLSIQVVVAAALALSASLLYAAVATGAPQLATEAVEGFLPLAAGWFVGDAAAARRRYLAGLAEQEQRERAAEAEQARHEIRAERVRIARELHDVVAHTLAVMTVQAGVGRRLMAQRPEEANAALESIEVIGRTAQEELRVVLGLLCDDDGEAASLAPMPKLADLTELAETVQASGTPVTLQTSGADSQLSPALELSIYRVVQEALTNVVKHAPGASATVDVVISSAEVRVEITDDGRRTGVSSAVGDIVPGQRARGQGIRGMRERIAAFGGSLVAEPLGDRGFHVVARVPANDVR